MGCKILIGLLFLTLFTYNSIPYKSDVDLVLYYWTIFLLVSSLYVFFRHYKIFCVNVKYGIQYGFRIFYLIALQNEENYEREESCSA